jgi:hypothetical protein
VVCVCGRWCLVCDVVCVWCVVWCGVVCVSFVSDEALSRLCFAGLAAHTLHRGPDGALHSDFLWLSGLPTRPGFEAYGARATFNDSGVLVGMTTNAGEALAPGDPGWDHAKWVFKASALVGVTLRDHLVGLHLLAANLLTSAAAERLSPDHPLRRLLKPHTYGTVTINRGASTYLLARRGLLHRAVGLTWDGILDGLEYSIKEQRWVGVCCPTLRNL